jgi:hypothetical protein
VKTGAKTFWQLTTFLAAVTIPLLQEQMELADPTAQRAKQAPLDEPPRFNEK